MTFSRREPYRKNQPTFTAVRPKTQFHPQSIGFFLVRKKRKLINAHHDLQGVREREGILIPTATAAGAPARFFRLSHHSAASHDRTFCYTAAVKQYIVQPVEIPKKTSYSVDQLAG